MMKLFVLILSIGFSNMDLCAGVKLRHGEREEMFEYNQPDCSPGVFINGPSNCSGNFGILSTAQFTNVTFSYDCNSGAYSIERDYNSRLVQMDSVGFPGENYIRCGTNSYGSYMYPFEDNQQCNGVFLQPNYISFVITGLYYNYTIDIIDAGTFQITREFSSLESATLYIDGKMVASISADSSTISHTQTLLCSSDVNSPQPSCTFDTNPNPNSPYIGNDYLRFYYKVPTFIIPFSPYQNPITDVCEDYPYVSESEQIMCSEGNVPIGPCLSNDIVTSATSFGSLYCQEPTFAPTHEPTFEPTMKPTPEPTMKPKGKSKLHH